MMNARNKLGIDWIRMEMLGYAKNERNKSNLSIIVLGDLASVINFEFPGMWFIRVCFSMIEIECLSYMSEVY